MEQVTDHILAAARKVIAVHINYPSRAAQRGRTPGQPSYFLKPSSSLALSGSTVERPAGCELLGYEGEIALIIGKPARRVGLEDAWSHVEWVTASNDLGVYDLRYADKGSNLRSKGGDGFTPVGPGLIAADSVDPAQLRIRTWHNGALVQDDTTGDLLFPFARLVADLSQLLTLEAGDIILTGTPAGASVAKPGDVVEVEVSAGDLTSGRLVTRVEEGTTPFADFGARPRTDDLQREEAYGSREAAGLAAPAPILSPELKAKLESVCTATLSSQLRKRGLNNVSIDGLSATRPEKRVVGLARTLRYVPNREDLFKTHGGGFNAQKKAIDSVNEGEILVMEARGEKGTGTIGDILALRAQVRGAAAIITDGGVRDFSAVAAMDMPTYYANPHPAVLGRRHIPWDTDITIACGGTTVQPGDIIVADSDGILVIPPALAEELADDSIAQEREEVFIAEMVQQGHSVDGLYPLNAEWRAKYETWEAGKANG
ncbi:2-keto-4-pentenoate hydratase/2-oxohepta-3-ene-1,7-dioic acid hydratase in catechol pathway/regulator of RNase E activity RraA [Arthrobacter ginsengisoli]|uniref:2-keto-4-pentenoate hydratase/2-oxohepta-3-ene-1,7-dioic acid hydratase in catechol pathway/regulator of RNase E activity RraA n=1 Tax=Arthrobacter ginsengisoli TaxID=1356565 RepID=A0ABU1UE79_9MICC|nr:fumarylacetoacetate hydrolase family protein [Arthrobacter ginsengisoli]MDR7083497.1 2-keto-4-pentenoate hydratase/2-oxohepta-3-ene-1,7-dioic acid hydratase in catechol pathway/regulator of RNase E activity RraA [Arthrobacter ginsengisoli]